MVLPPPHCPTFCSFDTDKNVRTNHTAIAFTFQEKLGGLCSPSIVIRRRGRAQSTFSSSALMPPVRRTPAHSARSVPSSPRPKYSAPAANASPDKPVGSMKKETSPRCEPFIPTYQKGNPVFISEPAAMYVIKYGFKPSIFDGSDECAERWQKHARLE